jgi:sulfur-oxidizing protein SoxY
MRWSRRGYFGLLGCAIVTALAGGRKAFAAGVPAADKFSSLFGDLKPEQSADIEIDLPVFAEAGARVPISVRTTLPNVDTISLLVEKNPQPLAASFRIAPPAAAAIQTQLRIATSCDVIALVKTRDPEGYFYASADVVIRSADSCP